MYKAIALTFGYVESESVAWIIFNSVEYSTRKELLNSFTEFLYNHFVRLSQEEIEYSNYNMKHRAKK